MHGNSMNAGQSTHNGPCIQYKKNGWDYRPVTIWDFLEGRNPA